MLADFVGKMVTLIIQGGWIYGILEIDETCNSEFPGYILTIPGGNGQVYLNQFNTTIKNNRISYRP